MKTVDEHLDDGPARASSRCDRIDLQLLDAHGCVLAEDVVAPLAAAARSTTRAMDGYAVRAADVAGATEDRPVVLPVVGDIAGRPARRRVVVQPGTACGS